MTSRLFIHQLTDSFGRSENQTWRPQGQERGPGYSTDVLDCVGPAVSPQQYWPLAPAASETEVSELLLRGSSLPSAVKCHTSANVSGAAWVTRPHLGCRKAGTSPNVGRGVHWHWTAKIMMCVY